MKKKLLKSAIVLAMPIVAFLLLGVFFVSGFSSGYVLALSEKGGGFYVRNNSTLTVETGSNISGNTAINGGGVYVEEGGTLKLGEYVLFGSYPQTYQADTSVITTSQDENGYYIGTDGNRYAKVSANPFSSSYTFNDGTTIVPEKEYYFKVEPLKWRILSISDGKALLFCENIINAHNYYSSESTRTINGTTIYASNYKYSNIRAWLNGYEEEKGNTSGEDWSTGGFLQVAFTIEEQNSIFITEVDNSAATTNSQSNIYACENTNDKIFLLSYKDMKNIDYGFSSSASPDSTRQKRTTDFAIANRAVVSNDAGWYWLRSPSSEYEYRAHGGSYNGDINLSSVSIRRAGVVPSLCVDVDALLSVVEGGTIAGNTATSGNGNDIYNAGTFTMTGGIVGVDIVRVDESGNVDPNGDYILFGSYPKTYQSDTSVITSTQDSNGYYLGIDGNRYAKVSANPYDSSYVFNDGTTIVSGTEYYFKVEPIKWRILKTENGKALLLCEDIIDAHKFNYTGSDRTINGSTIYANNYKYSDIRAWLNGYGQESGNTSGENWLGTGFLQKAFTTAEQNSILTTTVDNSASTTNSSSNSYACENTNDKVFLLSYQDMINTEYGFNSSYSNYDTARRKQTTDYARANYAWYSTSSDYLYNGYYWLRSPSSSDASFAYGVNDHGHSGHNYYVSSSINGVVPVLYISTSVFDEESGSYGIYNTGTMNLYGGTIHDSVYSETSFNVSMNANIQGTITLGDSATINVIDYEGMIPNYNIIVSGLRENGTILILNGNDTTPDLTKISITGFDTETKKIVADQNSSGIWEIKLATKQYRVSLTGGTGISSVSGAGLYDYGSQVTISAVVSEGYSWKNWTGSSTFSSQIMTITIGASDVSYTANATINQYTVSLSKGEGISSVSGAGSYDYGSQVTISAVVSEGYSWKNWTGSSTFSSQIMTITIGASDVSYTANATINQYTVSLSKGEGISSVSGAGLYDYGSEVEISAQVLDGYVWGCWTGNRTITEQTTTIIIGEGDVSFTATTSAISYSISVDIGSVNNGSYSTSSSEQQRTLSSASKNGYTFSSWSVSWEDEDHSSVSPSISGNTLIISAGTYGNIFVVALWIANTYTINFDTNGGTMKDLSVSENSEGLTVTTGNTKITATYDKVGIFTVTITRDGYTFNGWSCNGGGTISNLSTLPTSTPKTSVKNLSSKVNGSVTLTAIWKENFVRVDANGNEVEDGNYILFGSYPKTIKSSNVTIDTSSVDKNGYYLGSDGNRYASLVANVYTDEWNNETYYFSNGQAITTGTTYYFKVEPIKWRILTESNGVAFIVATDYINSMWFDDNYSLSNNYANSEIRAYLNGYSSSYSSQYLNNGFLQKNFSSYEQSLILTTTVDNSASTTIDSASAYACANTNDKIFLLSYADVTNPSYGFNSDYSVKETVRQRIGTDWARANYSFLSLSYGYTGYWWTRSPSTGEQYVIRVNYAGYALSGDYATSTAVGIVPAMRISGLKVKTSSFASNQKIEKEQEKVLCVDENIVSRFSFNISQLNFNAVKKLSNNVILKNRDLYFEKNKKGLVLLSIFDEKILLRKSQESEPVILSLNLMG